MYFSGAFSNTSLSQYLCWGTFPHSKSILFFWNHNLLLPLPCIPLPKLPIILPSFSVIPWGKWNTGEPESIFVSWLYYCSKWKMLYKLESTEVIQKYVLRPQWDWTRNQQMKHSWKISKDLEIKQHISR